MLIKLYWYETNLGESKSQTPLPNKEGITKLLLDPSTTNCENLGIMGYEELLASNMERVEVE